MLGLQPYKIWKSTDLRKDGIQVIEKLDTLKINSIANNISTKLCETFPQYNLNQNHNRYLQLHSNFQNIQY